MLQFLTLQAEAGNAAEAIDRVKQEVTDREALLPQKQDADEQLHAAATRLQDVVEFQKPGESSVTVEGDDLRMTYVLWVVCGGFSLAFILLLLLARHPHPVARFELTEDEDAQDEDASFPRDYADEESYEDGYEEVEERYIAPALTPVQAAAGVRGAALAQG